VKNRRTFPAGEASLAAVRDFAREQARDGGVSDGQREQIAAVVEEVFAGALEHPHAYPLEVRMRVTNDRIDLEFLQGDPRPVPSSGDRDVWTGPFSGWLSEELRDRGLSQEAAARRIGVSLKTVSRWVRGETEPRYRELALIQRAFGVQPIAFPARPSTPQA
jgi:anti-sigma regulatory factor (Ser/Thr protein kinase)